MKRFFILGFLFIALIFIGCDNPVTDLPTTDDTSFIVSENKYLFPAGTSALEIYNCLNNTKGHGQFNCTGTYTITATAVLNDTKYKDVKTYNIISVNIYSHEKPYNQYSNINSFHVDFTLSDGTTLPFCYKWQHSSTNAWHNNTLIKKSEKNEEIYFQIN